MKYALFLGCTIPARSRNYEVSARKVAEKLAIELEDVEDFICCGFPMKPTDRRSFNLMAAYNLALAEEKNLNICTLCSSCTSALTEAAHLISRDADLKKQLNEQLSKVGLCYEGGVRVRHFARLLYEEIAPDDVKTLIRRDLGELRIGVHYGCHYLKPSEIYDDFDDVENPRSIDFLVALTGARVIDYPGKKRCCGGPVLPVDEKVAMSVAKEKLDELLQAGADALCVVCPFCSVMYDGNQRSIESEWGTVYNLPVLYLPQILGLAMGLDENELGLKMNVVKTRDLLSRLGITPK